MTKAQTSGPDGGFEISDELAMQITNMNKWYNSFDVLKDINLAVHKGERVPTLRAKPR